MEVKRVVMAAAKTLGIEDGVKAYFEDGEQTTQREAELLLHCFNLVEKEIALDYIPLTMEDAMRTSMGQIDFDMLSCSPVRILGVRDERGEELAFELFPTCIRTKPGIVVISYTYTPNEKGIDDESSFFSFTLFRAAVYGVLTEYCLAQGLLEEAPVWNKKYKKAIEAVCGMPASKRLPSRRWV